MAAPPFLERGLSAGEAAQLESVERHLERKVRGAVQQVSNGAELR